LACPATFALRAHHYDDKQQKKIRNKKNISKRATGTREALEFATFELVSVSFICSRCVSSGARSFVHVAFRLVLVKVVWSLPLALMHCGRQNHRVGWAKVRKNVIVDELVVLDRVDKLSDLVHVTAS
jgi:hypothetical protein